MDVIICRPNFIEEPSLRTYAPDLLAQAGYRVINGGVAIMNGKNKITQHVLCSANGIPCPRWGIIQKSEDALAIAREIGFPVILKVAFGTHGKGVFFARDPETLQPIVEYLAVRDRNPIIVEEFIAEAGRKDLRAFLLGGEILTAMERAAPEGDVRANTSNGGIGTPIELSRAEADLAMRAAKLFSLDIAGVDIIRSNRGPLLLEVNANPGFKELERVTGMDVAGAIVDFVSK
jgi:ribosomal protein S6--L-glutamate ligase